MELSRPAWLPALLFAVAIPGIAALAACTGSGNDGGPDLVLGAIDDNSLRGVRVNPAVPKPDIILADTAGKDFDLRKETEGQLTLVFPGYTNCPDVCPTHMADLASVIPTLPDDVRERVRVVFITTDPARDTPERIAEWLANFDSSFVGLTGRQERIDDIQQQLGLTPASKTDLGNGEYAVNHGAFVYAFLPEDDTAYTVYPLGVSREDWTFDLVKLVREGWSDD